MSGVAIEWIVFGPLIVGGLVAAWLASHKAEERLNDPADDRVIWLDQLADKVALHAIGTYRVTIMRQSGNIHAEKIVRGMAADAVREAVGTFRRAKIDPIAMPQNDASRLRISRLYHDHRGSNEGRKVGWAVIDVLERQPLPELDIKLAPFVYDCPCGGELSFPFEELRSEHHCPACGEVIEFEPEEIASIEAEIDRVVADARDRHRRGEPVQTTGLTFDHDPRRSAL